MAKKAAKTEDRHRPSGLVRLPLDLYERIKALAEQDRRSVSNKVRIILEDYLAENESKNPATDSK
jgi:predicted DNA-binding protein